VQRQRVLIAAVANKAVTKPLPEDELKKLKKLNEIFILI
jgi:hypothetical protein